MGDDVSKIIQSCQLKPGQLLETLFDSIPGAYYFVKDRNGRFVTASKSFARTIGCETVGELVGKTDYDFPADFLADAFRQDDELVMSTRIALCNKVQLVPKTHSKKKKEEGSAAKTNLQKGQPNLGDVLI